MGREKDTKMQLQVRWGVNVHENKARKNGLNEKR